MVSVRYIVDTFTKLVEIIPTNIPLQNNELKKLQQIFANFGLPLKLISDNGKKFTSQLFNSFLKASGVANKTTALFHASSTSEQRDAYKQSIILYRHGQW